MHFRCPHGHDWDADNGAAHCPKCGAAAETRTLTISPQLGSEARVQLEQAINRFEDEWQQGNEPSLDAYLADFPNHRDVLLGELAQVDLELRLKRGEAVQVERYVARYPRLAEIPETLVALLSREFALRQRSGRGARHRRLLPTVSRHWQPRCGDVWWRRSIRK